MAEAVQPRSSENRPSKTAATSVGNSTMRPAASQAAKPEPTATVAPHQALLDQRLETIQIRATNWARGLEFEAPGEHSEPTEQRLLSFGE